MSVPIQINKHVSKTYISSDGPITPQIRTRG